MSSPDLPDLDLMKERLAELHEMIARALPGIDKPEINWLIARLVEAKIQNPKSPTATMLEIWSRRYRRIPVSVREFITGERYLNLSIGESGIYPKIIEGLEELFRGDYAEVILAGGIGYGKTTFGTIAVAYDVYKLSCLRDPATAYGLKTGSNITFVNVSVDKKQAKKVFFADLYDLIKASWYFNYAFPYDRGLKSEIRFPGNIHCYPVAASEQAALGVGVFSAFIDEVNFMGVIERSKRSTPGAANIYDQAEVVYNKLSERMRSRFNKLGKLPGHLFASSSARYPDDFAERLAKRARKEEEEGLHNMLVLNYAAWDTKPEGTISKETFRVEVGDLTRNSRILTGAETDVVEANVIDVPVDYRLPFERDVERAVQNLAGRSVLSIRPFISQREKIRKMFELGEEAGLQHPFTRLTVTLQDKNPALERLLPENLHWVLRQKKNELGNPKFENGKPMMEKILYPALYHAHFDLSKTGDATGFCVGHVVGKMKCRRFDEDKMQNTEEIKPIIRIDWIQRIVPPPHGEIDIPRVRALLYKLTALGMEFGSVTCDTFGSQESVKTLKEKGYRADIFSLDTDKDGYSALKDAIYDGRVLCYENPILERELAQLEDTGKKIDHPSSPGSSKDLADCLAGVVRHCGEGWRSGERIGGMFDIGLVECPGRSRPNPTRERAVSKVVEGEELTPEEENELIFGDFRPEEV